MGNFLSLLFNALGKAIREKDRARIKELKSLSAYNRKKEILIQSIQIINGSKNLETIIKRAILVSKLFNELFEVLKVFPSEEEFSMLSRQKSETDRFLSNYLANDFNVSFEHLIGQIKKSTNSDKRVKLTMKWRDLLSLLERNELIPPDKAKDLRSKLYNSLD